jgi:pimeloyl-ACP methyl ester carboxylesterase
MGSDTVCSSFVTFKDLRYYHRSWEADGGGDYIVLLHGLGSNARIWDLVAPSLAEAGFRVAAFDMRGHGSSAKTNHGYTFETLSGDLRGLIEISQIEKPILVGHSFGAVLALDYAARNRRGKWAPSGIVLVDGGMAQLDTLPGATWEGVKEVLAPSRYEGTTLAAFLSQFKDPDRKWKPDDRALDLILTNFEIRRNGTIKPLLTYTRHLKALKSLWGFKTYACYDRVNCPVLMVPVLPSSPHSTEEEIHLQFKDQALEVARASIQELHVSWLKDAIHEVPLQKPQELAELIIQFASA